MLDATVLKATAKPSSGRHVVVPLEADDGQFDAGPFEPDQMVLA
jgi:hypothetical protein